MEPNRDPTSVAAPYTLWVRSGSSPVSCWPTSAPEFEVTSLLNLLRPNEVLSVEDLFQMLLETEGNQFDAMREAGCQLVERGAMQLLSLQECKERSYQNAEPRLRTWLIQTPCASVESVEAERLCSQDFLA